MNVVIFDPVRWRGTPFEPDYWSRLSEKLGGLTAEIAGVAADAEGEDPTLELVIRFRIRASEVLSPQAARLADWLAAALESCRVEPSPKQHRQILAEARSVES